MQNVEEKEEWNKKRIIIAICFASILLVGIAYFLKNAIFDDDRKLSSKAIQGAKTEKENTETQVGEAVSKDAFLPLKTSIKEKLDILKKEVANLNVEDIASSSPQIQKIINDFNSLKQYPVDEIKDICREICGL
jgi:hypothetical protein